MVEFITQYYSEASVTNKSAHSCFMLSSHTTSDVKDEVFSMRHTLDAIARFSCAVTGVGHVSIETRAKNFSRRFAARAAEANRSISVRRAREKTSGPSCSKGG